MFTKKIKEQAVKTINHKKKEMIPLTGEEKRHIKLRKFATYVKKNFLQIKKIYNLN